MDFSERGLKMVHTKRAERAENENEVTCEQNQPKSAIKFNKKHSKFNEIWRGD